MTAPAPRLASEAAVLAALEKMYPPREYAFFPHVRNGTGYARRETRTADAVAMSLWPSRGLVLHGFEVKVSRRDWLTEKADPSKADAIGAYCDRFWLAAGAADIVEPGELPDKWGLIVPEDRPRRTNLLRVAREAQPLDSKPLDRLLVASLLREGRRGLVPSATVDQAARERVAAAEVDRDEWRKRALDRGDDAHTAKRLRESIDAFEQASGVRIGGYDGSRIGAAVRAVLEAGVNGAALAERLADIARRAAAVQQEAERHVERLRAETLAQDPP